MDTTARNGLTWRYLLRDVAPGRNIPCSSRADMLGGEPEASQYPWMSPIPRLGVTNGHLANDCPCSANRPSPDDCLRPRIDYVDARGSPRRTGLCGVQRLQPNAQLPGRPDLRLGCVRGKLYHHTDHDRRGRGLPIRSAPGRDGREDHLPVADHEPSGSTILRARSLLGGKLHIEPRLPGPLGNALPRGQPGVAR